MRLTHPIFQGPLRPEIETVKRDAPANYLQWPGGEKLAQLDCWTVQVGKVAAEVDYGLVSTPFGFEDTPDAEAISSGINSKGPTSVALGRHANLFLWGFAGDPTQMTASAQRVFVNAIVYMDRFDGQRPLAPKKSQSREWALVYLSFARYWKDGVPSDHVKRLYEASLWQQAGSEAATSPAPGGGPAPKPNVDKLRAILAAELEYLRHDGKTFAIDEDAKALGKSTRSPEILEAIAARLVTDAGDAVARRLLARYLPEQAKASAEELAAWLSAHRGKLFFSDVGGYRWFVDTRAAAKGGDGASR